MKLNFKKHVLPAVTILAAAVTMPAQAAYLCTGATSSTGDFFNGDLTDPGCNLDDVNTALGTSWIAADFVGSKTNWNDLIPNDWNQDEFALGTLTITDFVDPFTSGTWTLTGGSVAPVFFVDKYDGGYDLYTYLGGGISPFSDSWDAANRGTIGAACTTNGGTINCKAETSHISVYGVVPIPAAVWLFGSGLLGLIGIARRKKS